MRARRLLPVLTAALLVSAVPSHAAPVDPSSGPTASEVFSTTPEGPCPRWSNGTVSYRNTSGRTANEYRRIGTSHQGRPIWAEHWGSRTGRQILVVAQVHGNECSPAIFLAELRANPPVGYGVWVIPTLNPDGLAAGTRRSAARIDLNRDGLNRRARETRVLLAFTTAVRPALTIHIHSPLEWIGRYNGGLAGTLASAMGRATSLRVSGAGSNPDHEAYLWQGQASVLPGHPSVLIELPRFTSREASSVSPERGPVRSVSAIRTLSRQMLSAMQRTLTR